MLRAPVISRLLASSWGQCQVRWSSAISKPVFHRGDQWDRRKHLAMVDENGTHTYGDISIKSRMVANALQAELGNRPERHKKISFLCGNNSSFVDAMWGIWRWGHVCVPLCKTHPTASLEYYVKDSDSLAVIATKDLVDKIMPFMRGSDKKLLLLEEILENVGQNVGSMSVDIFDDDIYDENDDALMIYTSGTTGSPKGVVLSHKNVINQINAMLDAWGWHHKDCILHVLPLHHTHGMINCLLCPLAVGAKIIMMPKFDAGKCWEILLNRNETSVNSEVDVFMAVPTIYAKLIQKYNEPEFQAKYDPEDVKQTILEKIRLTVCGSAALPTPILEEWKRISGHTLLERYGMTELGMVLSDPFEQEARKPGFVGNPMPGVQVRIVKPGTTDVLVMGDYDGTTILNAPDQTIVGELQVKGPSVFKCYHNRPEATKKEFTKDKWFKTGDTAEFVPSDGSDGYDGAYKILGRSNVDVIKTGGYKVGALDVERILLEHEAIHEVAVIGVEDLTWGQKVGAVVAFEEGVKAPDLSEIREWARDKLPSYSLPTVMKVMDKLPRNVMGQVNKKDLMKLAFPPDNSQETAAQ